MLLALYRNLRFSLNQRFELELALSRLAQLDDLISPAELREAIAELRSGTPPGSGRRQTRAVPPAFLHSEKPPAAAPPRRDSASRRASGGQPAPAAAAATAPARRRSPRARRVNPRDLVARLVDALRREKPAVASALEKAAVSIEGDELVLTFSPQNRFHGERGAEGRRTSLNARLAALAPVKVARVVRRGDGPRPARWTSGSSCCARCSAARS